VALAGLAARRSAHGRNTMSSLQVQALDYGRSLLLTDLYQVNMIEAYLAAEMENTPVIDFFIRKLAAHGDSWSLLVSNR